MGCDMRLLGLSWTIKVTYTMVFSLRNSPISTQFIIITTLFLVGMTGCYRESEVRIVTPMTESAEFVGNSSCETCHQKYVAEFGASPHGQFHGQGAAVEKSGETGCESCHGPGSLHAASGGSKKGLIVNPGKNPEACLQCHITQHAEFKFPYRHPVIEGRMNCVDCHDPHGQDIFRSAGGLITKTTKQFCGECHPAQSHPSIFEHEAMTDGCQSCHKPHGSPNRKMLITPGPNLCLRCHAQFAGPSVAPGKLIIGAVDHSSFVSQGSCWSSGCHTAVHGSNVQPTLLY